MAYQSSEDGRNEFRLLLLALAVSVVLTGSCFWISDLTGGPEHGARYDVPALSSAAWFAFVAMACVTLMLLAICISRAAEQIQIGKKLRRGTGPAN